MPTASQITDLSEEPPPPGASPWVGEREPVVPVVVVDPDPAWPARFEEVAARVRAALGPRVLTLDHVGSTSVPGLAAKPIVDLDLVVADSDDEAGYLPALEAAGFVLRVREPWWEGHRLLRGTDPASNLHVFGPGSAVPWRDRVFRDHLRRDDADRALYERAKRDAAAQTTAAGERVMDYNARKRAVLREVFARAFAAAGLG